MSVKLLAEHHLEFLSLNGGCTGLSESTLVKMPHCWKSHVTAHMPMVLLKSQFTEVIYIKLPFNQTYLRTYATKYFPY